MLVLLAMDLNGVKNIISDLGGLTVISVKSEIHNFRKGTNGYVVLLQKAINDALE